MLAIAIVHRRARTGESQTKLRVIKGVEDFSMYHLMCIFCVVVVFFLLVYSSLSFALAIDFPVCYTDEEKAPYF